MTSQWDEAAEAASWPEPEPLPTGLPPVDAFKDDLLPLGLRAYVMDISDRMQCPPDFPAVAFMTCFSSLAGGRIAIKPKRQDDWTVLPNLWGAIVGRPSLMKTPALTEATKMLYRLETLARAKHKEEMLDFEARQLAAKMQATAAKSRAQEMLKKGADYAALVEALRTAQEEPDKPAMRRYMVNDSTVEKLGEILQDNPEGLLVFRDELVGWLRNMDRDGHEGDRAFYLEAWTGGRPFTYDRIARGSVFIERVTVAALGGIQPGPLRGYVSQAAQGGAGDDGLLQRLQLLVWPDASDEWRNVDRWPDTEAKQAVWRIFERFAEMALSSVDEGAPATRFAEDGQELFDDWRTELEQRLRNGDMPAALESHLAKYRSLVPSLALLSHLIEGEAPLSRVGASHVRRAIDWTVYLESHARRVYGTALDPEMAAAIALSDRLGDLPDSFTARDVYRRGWSGLDRKAADGALDVLVEFGHLVAESRETGGRPTITYRKNPRRKKSDSSRGGTDKTDKRGATGAFGSFGSNPPGESENFSPDDYTPMDGEV